MYHAPVNELRFLIQALRAEQPAINDDYSAEVIDSVLAEAARFAEQVLEPLNRSGDIEGSHLSPEGVRTPKGFAAAYRQFVEAGWPQLPCDPDFGGQGAPMLLHCAVQEMWASANLSFKLCPMLTQAAVEALHRYGSSEQQAQYLPKLVSGEWTGTMALTEANAGSDLALVRTRAVPRDRHFLLFGQKIFITWGDHDCAANIVHLVLARVEGAPPGVQGLSLFIVPKFLTGPDGQLGARNDVHCVSIEHKLGLHASPTCLLDFGQSGGAKAFLVGEPHRGLQYMFVMMNAARLAVGIEGYALSERAYQHALEWATRRIQGKGPREGGGPVAIVQHADVRRMLLMLKSGTEAMRALTLYAALQFDLSRAQGAGERASSFIRGELLTPIVKGWCTEFGNELVGIALQIHGGAGYLEETGIAQHVRDARISTIYEGTTGIQAIDLIRRKIQRDGGVAMFELIQEMERDLRASSLPSADLALLHSAASDALGRLDDSTRAMVHMLRAQPENALAVAEPYMRLCGYTISGWLMAKLCRSAVGESPISDFARRKVLAAVFYARHILPRASALALIVSHGADCVTNVSAEDL